MEFIKDVFQFFSWAVAIIGGLIAAFRAIAEMRYNREQRQTELRWRKSKEAKKVLDDLYENRYSKAAMTMLEWDGRKYDIGDGVIEKISWKEMLKGLRIDNLENLVFSEKEMYIRECFDQFFYKLAYFNHLENTGLIIFEDLSGWLRYHVELMAKDKKIHIRYLKYYKFSGTISFLKKFNEWKK